MKHTNFIEAGSFYKGATHCHTTHSDGVFTPLELAGFYRKLGFSFMSITDHRYYGCYPELCTDDFLVLPGIELECDFNVHDKNYHVVGIGTLESTGFKNGDTVNGFQYKGFETAREMANLLHSRGNIAIFAHPRWSLLQQSETGNFAGFDAMEIFNGLSQLEEGCGYSDTYFDLSLFDGAKSWCVACDDCHGFMKTTDLGLGWVCVKAKEFTQQSIIDSLLCGSFYSSTGPQIHDFYVENGVAHVKCSPCRSIHFLSWPFRGFSFTQEHHPLESAQWNCAEDIEYVRVLCKDEKGYEAWSNPIWLSSRGGI